MGLVTAWVVFIVLLVVIISAALWGLGVFTSDIKGRGDAKKQHNSASNRIFAQQHFEDLNAAIDRDKANIRVAALAAKSDPSQVNKTNLVGTQQICNADVADYNASARKFLERDFKAADLPSSIDLAVCEGE